MAAMDGPTSLISGIEPLLSPALHTLNEYLKAEDSSRAVRDKAKLALQVLNTAITIQRSLWTQQRHETSIARTLSDGDLDLFQKYVRDAIPAFPVVRKVALPEA